MNEHIVLILDANQRSALACTRSLGRAGVSRIYTSDSSENSLAGTSKYSTAYFQLPDASIDCEKFLEELTTLVSENKIDFILPVTEISIRLILENARLFSNCTLPFADFKTVLRVSDKQQLMREAEILQIKVPKTQYFSSLDEWDYSLENDFPLVIKPALSRMMIDNKWIGTTVRIVRDESELLKFIKLDTYLKNTHFMIQEFIPGHGEGIFALYNNGTAICHFSHQRIREKPPRGGVSVVSRAIPVNAELKAIADSLLETFGWSGAAMVEFRVDGSGTPYLMEINTRFWGSLQLSIDAGVNFPVLVYRQFTEEAPIQKIDYQPGNQLRWYLGDLDNLYLFLRDKNKTPKQKLAHFFQFFKPHKNTRNEILRKDDWKPAIFELKNYLREIFAR